MTAHAVGVDELGDAPLQLGHRDGRPVDVGRSTIAGLGERDGSATAAVKLPAEAPRCRVPVRRDVPLPLVPRARPPGRRFAKYLRQLSSTDSGFFR